MSGIPFDQLAMVGKREISKTEIMTEKKVSKNTMARIQRSSCNNAKAFPCLHMVVLLPLFSLPAASCTVMDAIKAAVGPGAGRGITNTNVHSEAFRSRCTNFPLLWEQQTLSEIVLCLIKYLYI